MIADGWVSHSWAAGFMLGLLFGVIFLAPVAYLLTEEWWSNRQRKGYRADG